MNTWIAGRDLTSLPDFYSNLNMEDITDGDYMRAKRVSKEFKIKNLGEYHDLYVQSDVFGNFRNKGIGIYELDPGYFLLAHGLAWQTCLKKQKQN